MSEYYEYFKKLVQRVDVKKIVNEFFKKHEKDIVRSWLSDYAFCILEDYNTAQCDEYLVASDMAREIVQPLYNLVEEIENEINARLLQLFISYRPCCANCKYFVIGKDAEKYVGELAHDEGYCIKHNKIFCDDDGPCKHYQPS